MALNPPGAASSRQDDKLLLASVYCTFFQADINFPQHPSKSLPTENSRSSLLLRGKLPFWGAKSIWPRRASQCCQTTNLKRGIASGIRPCANHPSTGQSFVRHLVKKKKENKYKNRKAQQNTHTQSFSLSITEPFIIISFVHFLLCAVSLSSFHRYCPRYPGGNRNPANWQQRTRTLTPLPPQVARQNGGKISELTG